MEENSIKAIYIGVSVFVTVIVLSAIVMYISEARKVAEVATSGISIEQYLDDVFNKDVSESGLTGVEVRTLINKYAGDTDVSVRLNGSTQSINIDWCITASGESKPLINEKYLNTIEPAKKYSIIVEQIDDINNYSKKTIITIK